MKFYIFVVLTILSTQNLYSQDLPPDHSEVSVPSSPDAIFELLSGQARARTGAPPALTGEARDAYQRIFNHVNNQLYLHNLDKEKLFECLKSIGITEHSSQAEKLLKKLGENQDQLNTWLGDLQWLLGETEDRAKIEASFLELLDVQEEKLSVWVFDEFLSPDQLMKFSTFLSQQWLAKSLYHPFFALVLEFDDEQKVQLTRLSRRLDAVREKMFSESNRAKASAQLEKHFFDTLCVLRVEQLVAYLRITGKASATDELAEAISKMPDHDKALYMRYVPLVREQLIGSPGTEQR